MHFPPPRDPTWRPPPDPHAPRPSAGPPASRLGPRPPLRSTRPPPKRWWPRLAVAGALAAAVAGGGLALRARYLPDAFVLPGVTIDGEPVPAGADEAAVRALVAARADRLAAREVRLRMPGAPQPALVSTLGALGLRVDVDETVAIAARFGQWGDLWSRALAARAASEGRVDVPLVTSVEPASALEALAPLKEAEDAPPVSARLDLDAHRTIPERPGRYVDADGIVARLEGATRGPDAVVEIEAPVAELAPRITASYLAKLDVSSVVAEYETYFSRRGEQSRRGQNVDNAARKLDGVVISPGEMVSFNDVVGERSEANGFAKSWEIFKGEMVEGVGGGTCQVASTFHAAAFFAGFDVLERLPHSRPSAYIPMGLDSTVVYPAVDLKVRNPHPFPVVVHATTQGNKLRIELLGKSRPVRVSFGRELVDTIPYKRKVVEDARLTGKRVVRKQHGINGFRMKRKRLLVYADGTRKKEETTDFYPPTTEIYEVPIGFDEALLPPLPGGDDEEPDAADPAAAPPPPVAAVPSLPDGATASAGAPADPEVEVLEGKGSHAPSAAQANPAKKVWVNR